MPSEIAPGERVALVVDDNARHAALSAAVLEASNWQVDVAKDGFEGIMRLGARSYGLLVLDYRLPGMDGSEVLGWAHRNLPEVPPVIVLSSECRDLLKARFSGMGVLAILSKPAAASDFCRALAAA